MGLSRGVLLLLDPAEVAAPARESSAAPDDFYSGLDGYARRGRLGRRDFATGNASQWSTVSTAQRDPVLNIFRDLRHAGLAGTNFADGDPAAACSGRGTAKGRGGAGT